MPPRTHTSLDRRTRRDAEVVDLGPEVFFSTVAPDLVAANGDLVAAGMAALGASPLTLRVDGTEHSLVLDGDRLAVVEGPADGALVVTFTRARFSSFAQQQITFLALNLGALLECAGGHDDDLEAWDSLWPAFIDGRTVIDADLTFLDRHGAPLDIHRSFTRDDDPADVAHFLREAGYVHLRGWLDPDLMGTIADEMDRAVADHVPGDGRSWWATLDDGTETVVRLQEWVERSPATKAMLEGEAWAAAGRALAGDEVLEPMAAEGRCIEALIKPLGVTKGISDIAWHRDCAFGRCSYECAGLTAGTAVTAGGPASGLLRVVAGSHRVLMPSEWARDRSYLPIVDLPTDVGDITVHLSCTLHEARPPVSAPRKVMYGGFAQLPGKAEAAAGAAELWAIRELIGGPDAPPPSRPVSAGRTHGN